MSPMYHATAIFVLCVHLAFICWLIFGALFTRGRPVLRWIHYLSLGWGLLIEIVGWTCPLTLAENWLEVRAGKTPYTGGFMLHYLDALVYPNVPPRLLTAVGVIVILINVAVYWRRWLMRQGPVAPSNREVH